MPWFIRAWYPKSRLGLLLGPFATEYEASAKMAVMQREHSSMSTYSLVSGNQA